MAARIGTEQHCLGHMKFIWIYKLYWNASFQYIELNCEITQMATHPHPSIIYLDDWLSTNGILSSSWCRVPAIVGRTIGNYVELDNEFNMKNGQDQWTESISVGTIYVVVWDTPCFTHDEETLFSVAVYVSPLESLFRMQLLIKS